MKKTIIYFQMLKGSEVERVIFSSHIPTDSEVGEYFESQCGGVYKWWREDV